MDDLLKAIDPFLDSSHELPSDSMISFDTKEQFVSKAILVLAELGWKNSSQINEDIVQAVDNSDDEGAGRSKRATRGLRNQESEDFVTSTKKKARTAIRGGKEVAEPEEVPPPTEIVNGEDQLDYVTSSHSAELSACIRDLNALASQMKELKKIQSPSPEPDTNDDETYPLQNLWSMLPEGIATLAIIIGKYLRLFKMRLVETRTWIARKELVFSRASDSSFPSKNNFDDVVQLIEAAKTRGIESSHVVLLKKAVANAVKWKEHAAKMLGNPRDASSLLSLEDLKQFIREGLLICSLSLID